MGSTVAASKARSAFQSKLHSIRVNGVTVTYGTEDEGRVLLWASLRFFFPAADEAVETEDGGGARFMPALLPPPLPPFLPAGPCCADDRRTAEAECDLGTAVRCADVVF